MPCWVGLNLKRGGLGCGYIIKFHLGSLFLGYENFLLYNWGFLTESWICTTGYSYFFQCEPSVITLLLFHDL